MEKVSVTTPLPVGCSEAIHSVGIRFEFRPDGLYASDAAAAKSIIDSYVGSAAELSYHKTQKLDDLATLYAAKYTAGRTYQGVVYQIDPASQANITGSGAIAAQVLANTPGADPWPAGFYWIAADNSHVAMNAAAMFAFAQNVASYVTGLIVTNRAIKDAIDGAANMTMLSAIDITTGWPTNP